MEFVKIIFRYCFFFLFLSSCIGEQTECLISDAADVSMAELFAGDDDFIFRFPLDKLDNNALQGAAVFKASGQKSPTITHYHCAEDYHLPPGTPVFAIADGIVNYSGKMGGYGWLVIIDHKEFNIYSLYGHLSPGRWNIKDGTHVMKGDLIGYLGDSDENGGSEKNPLVPHLHHGIRRGQMNDYPGGGQWRWMAGWIALCPTSAGWLQPSFLINSQTVPDGGFQNPPMSFWSVWGMTIILAAAYITSAAGIMFFSFKKNKLALLFIGGSFMILVSAFFRIKNPNLAIVTICLSGILLLTWIVRVVKRRLEKSPSSSNYLQ